MLAIKDIIDAKKRSRKRPDEGYLRRLPYKHAFIYGRLSSPGQVRESHESIREISRLVDLTKQDGFCTNLSSDDVETKLISLQQASTSEKTWSDGEVTVDVQDLGISGQVSFEKRQGLTELQRRVRRGEVGAVYLTEGVSRLSRDKDHILPYQLLKLLKEHECRIRTLDGVWNPAIERDWDYLAEEFEDAIGELRLMNRRMFRRKMQKAQRGEYVGEPIPPGYFLPITGKKPSGEFEYGKMEPYPPHAEIVNRVLEQYVYHGGSRLKTLRALGGLTLPFFPSDLQYMERLTSLRSCPKTEVGYAITSTLIRGMATNLKMIGIWQWGETEPIINNHALVVLEKLFLKAWQLANDNKKHKGKTINCEPMEWSGLLYCMNHTEPRKIASLSSKRRYACQRDYVQEASSICLDITARFINEPLTTTVLSQLDFTPFTEEILAGLESEDGRMKMEERQAKQQNKKLEEEINKWQSLLPCCVNNTTGIVDKEKEAFYWGKIRDIQEKLESIKAKPVTRNIPAVDFNKVREFLKGLTGKWYTYSLTSRNQLLKLIIESVELRGSQNIEATINWKTGLRQRVIIHRPVSNSKLERRWTAEEDRLLRMRYPSSSADALIAAIPNRTWKAITLRARRLNINRVRGGANHWQKWTSEEDEKLNQLCQNGMEYGDIALELGRSVDSVATRVRGRGLSEHRSSGTRKSRVHWEASQLLSLQELSSRGGHRG